jgi:hypothetical protein
MLDMLCTLLVKFIVHHLRRPRTLVIQSWLWLAAEAHTLEEKRRSLNAVLKLDRGDEPAAGAPLVLLRTKRIKKKRAGKTARLAKRSTCPQRNSNPRRRLERAVS